MQSSELRLGNLIYNGIGEPFQVNGETINNYILGQSVLGSFNPIKLIDEWLLKLGFEEVSNKIFEKCGNDTQGRLFTFRVMMHDKGYWIIYEVHEGGERQGLNLGTYEYVHTLQNIYPITGEELEIKE